MPLAKNIHKIDLSMDMNDENVMTQPSDDGTRPGRNSGALMPFKPGQSGNPDGMKKGTLHFSTIMRRLLAEPMSVTINGANFTLTRAQALMLEKIRLATNSDNDAVRLRAIMEVGDRVEGQPVSLLPTPLGGADDGVIFYIPNRHSRKRKEK